MFPNADPSFSAVEFVHCLREASVSLADGASRVNGADRDGASRVDSADINGASWVDGADRDDTQHPKTTVDIFPFGRILALQTT